MDPHPSGTRTGSRKSSRGDGEGLWDWNLVTNRIHFSPGWTSLVGCQDHEIGSTPDAWFQRVHPDDSGQLRRDIEAACADGAREFDLRYRLRHENGTYRWMSSRGIVVRNVRGEAIRLTGAQADVTVETVTDRVTGLPNRLLLLDRLTQSINRVRRYSTFQFALLLIELGRPAGTAPKSNAAADPLLNAAARRLETCLRKPDALPGIRQSDLVARVEGDRLAVLLDGLSDLNHATRVADRVLADMLNPFTLSGREIRLSSTIGIALSATGYTHPDEALRDAETALHRARVLGGSHFEVFDAHVLTSQQSAMQLEHELELALQRGGLALVYQPIVSVASNEVVGFEALVRWHHAVLGVVSPLDFIPMAERTGLIVPLGRWVLQEACLQLRALQASLPTSRDLWMSVNLSGVQLRDPMLPEQIEDALRNSDLEARSLVLELTEGVAMENPVAVTTLLMRVRALGIRISIDDFGTGYSSLSYLRQLPIDALKIDQSFVRRIAQDKDTAAIVTSIVAMAKELGIYVVAEGVEEEAQLTMLRSLHCESAQGFLFAEPLDPKRAGEFLRKAPSLGMTGADLEATGSPHGSVARLQQWSTTTLAQVGKGALAAAAVLAVLATAGVAALFHAERPSPHQSRAPENAGSPPADDARGPSEEGSSSSLPDDGVAIAVNSARTPASPAAATLQPSLVASPGIKIEGTGGGAARRSSFDVAHLHRIGRCRGRLTVSRTGVEFASDRKDRDDDFTLKFGEFVQAVDGNTLTIRSAARVYRFMLATGSPGDPAETPLDIEDAIVHAHGK
jgi:diguanylate cyclase (GGDEF)-like protein